MYMVIASLDPIITQFPSPSCEAVAKLYIIRGQKSLNSQRPLSKSTARLCSSINHSPIPTMSRKLDADDNEQNTYIVDAWPRPSQQPIPFRLQGYIVTSPIPGNLSDEWMWVMSLVEYVQNCQALGSSNVFTLKGKNQFKAPVQRKHSMNLMPYNFVHIRWKGNRHGLSMDHGR